MSIILGGELFPDTVMTATKRELALLFAARAATTPLQDRTAKQLIADWTAQLDGLRKQRQGIFK